MLGCSKYSQHLVTSINSITWTNSRKSSAHFVSNFWSFVTDQLLRRFHKAGKDVMLLKASFPTSSSGHHETTENHDDEPCSSNSEPGTASADEVHDQASVFSCKCFGQPAETLAGFTAAQLVALEKSGDIGAIESMFANIDYTTIWTLVINIKKTIFNDEEILETKVLSCERKK